MMKIEVGKYDYSWGFRIELVFYGKHWEFRASFVKYYLLIWGG